MNAEIPSRGFRTHLRWLAPLAALMLGVAHGCGANLPQFAYVQTTVTIALLVTLLVANSNKLFAASALSALIFSCASAAAAHAWIFLSLSGDAALGVALGGCVFVALVVGLALLPAAAIAVSSWLATKNSLAPFMPLVLAAAYPLAEYGSDALLGFTWQSLGYAGLGTPLENLLPWIGARGVTALVMLASAYAAMGITGWLAGHRNVPRGALVALSSVVIVTAAAGIANYQPGTQPAPEPVAVRLVQPALPIQRKFDAARQRDTVRQLVALAQDPRAHLVVAPETVLPHSWARMSTELGDPLLALVEGTDRTLLLGLFDADEEGRLLNVAVAVNARSRHTPPETYAKRHLVPVAEQATPGLRWISDALALPFMDRAPGTGPAEVIVTPRVALRTTICLDLLYGNELSDDAGAVGLLVNQSNLVALPGERMREQFLAIARTRAREQHKPLLLVSNDGPTAVIDADGRVLARLPFGEPGGLSHEVRPQLGRTPYAVLGDVTWSFPLTIAALVVALRRARPRAAAAAA